MMTGVNTGVLTIRKAIEQCTTVVTVKTEFNLDQIPLTPYYTTTRNVGMYPVINVILIPWDSSECQVHVCVGEI